LILLSHTAPTEIHTLSLHDALPISGDRVALVGESGGGKTTIVNLLLGLYRMRSGRIEVAGVDVGAGNLAELRRRVGVVFQDASLFSGTIGRTSSMAPRRPPMSRWSMWPSGPR